MGRSPYRWLMFFLVKSIFMQTDVTSIQCHCTRGCSDGFSCKTGGQCEKGWSGSTCQKQNIALGKPTQQSSTANDCQWAENDPDRLAHCGYKNSTLAVDGKTSSDYWSGHTCTHTQTGQRQAWWSVDLGDRHQISDIKIFFPNKNKDRMKNFRATVDGHPCYHWSKTYPPTSPLLVTCDTSLIGHSITIVSGRVRDVILNLCEVEIYECSDGTFGADCSKQCHCRNVSEICNKTTGHCLSGCTAGYTGPGCSIKNIALGKPTQQSSTADDCKWAGNNTSKLAHCGYKNSTLAVDGKISSDYWSGHTCTHTQTNQQQAWWSVDLGDRHQISDIKIFFSNPNKDRMKDFRVLVDGHLCYHWSETDPPTSPVLVTCDTSLIGHNITIVSGRAEDVILNLCEVEIYECIDGTFGANCYQQCHCRNVSEICNKSTGYCLSGCTAGYTGPGCNTICQDGWYGRNCNETCGACLSQATCYKETGQCPNEICEPGWSGKNCQKECIDGYFGSGCTALCNCKDIFDVCNKTTGQCGKNGCKDGWTGPDCYTECNDGFFGSGCKRHCNCKDIHEVCNKTTGQCDKSGCKVGLTGPDCYTECDNGTYGYNCSGTCGRCRLGDICTKIEGECPGGCQDGFSEPLCQDCADGHYGTDCVICGHCFDDRPCDKGTGHCHGICKPGWAGEKCQRPCKNGTYGYNCSGSCGRCRGNEVCDTIDGKCSRGCRTRYLPPLCKECTDGSYGPDCVRCGPCFGNSACDKLTGQCPDGCQAGWKGDNCQEVCDNGTYGLNCSGTCGRCRRDEMCDKNDGSCDNGCQEGFTTPLCQKCADGSYGSDCVRCGQCLRNSACDKLTGRCPNGCQAGWEGDNCHKVCDNGTYGLNCSGACGRCRGDETCDKNDGSCSNGCQEGFSTPLCQECTDGHYGPDCVRCGQCFGNSSCDKLTGECLNGCQAGWKGDNCEEDCNGTFGYNCNETCGLCFGGTPCDSVTGRCPGDCHPQYEGEFCRLLKPVKASIGPYVWLCIVILVLLMAVLLLVIYGRKRRRRSEKKPILMSSILGTNDSDATCSAEPKPLRPPSYKSKNISAEQQDEDNDTYVNIESTKVKVENLHEYIQDKPDQFEAEYKRIPKGLLHPHVAASAPENRSKNRYKSMNPYDHSRVVLVKLPDLDHSDYINASYIDGYKTKRSYIATQGPNPVTIGDFWRMVWQEQCPIIVMLTNLSEGARVKCEKYWPDEDRAMVRGNLQISNQGTIKKADYIIREFTVLNIDLDKKHHVTQLHYVTWPDHDVPSAPALVRFWKVFRSMAALNTGPFIIHCSAGVGRTGTFIALDALVSQAREEGAVNLFEFVRKMRQDRLSMVQTKEQYYFLHVVLLEALYSEGTLMTPGTFDERFNEEIQCSQIQQNVIQTQWRHVKELRGVLTDAAVSDSLLEENIRKTRNKEILPPDVARPALRTPAPNTNDYINAVFIPTESDEKGLVVTQLPLPWTVVDFWRLVLDHSVRTVVILDSHDRVQAEDEGLYWPQISQVLSCEPFTVSKVETKKGKVTTVKVQVWQEDSAESVKHDVNLVYTKDWSKIQETPTNVADFLTLVNEIETLKDEGPIVVMCRDGASRSGLFCAALNIVQRLKSDSEIDIYLLIRQLQTIRPGFITSYAQYEFCYKLVKEFQKTVTVLYENYQASSAF